MTLISRSHTADDGMVSEAVYSPCEKYRYSLTRTWDGNGRKLLYLMLNPSKATELANDPTIERCQRRAVQLGYGAFRVCNLFALRATNPARLKRARNPEGPANVDQLILAAKWCDSILCAWGVHGAHRAQHTKIAALLGSVEKPLLSLGTTKEGHPRHPLYVSYAVKPSRFE